MDENFIHYIQTRELIFAVKNFDFSTD
jgi:hypothetical protein